MFSFANIIFSVGLFTVISAIYHFCIFLYRKFLKAPINIFQTYGQSDSWAIVTGSSDGIGKAFCENLAQKNFNICFIVRNPIKIEKVREEIQSLNPQIQTVIIIADLALSPKDPISFYQKINEELTKKNISNIAILINNAGYSATDYFEQMKEIDIAEQIAVNIYPAAFLTRLIIPKMLTRPKKSLIINLASITGQVPLPFSGIYGSTKAFNEVLGRSLSLEYKGKIDVMVLKPNYVSTKMTNKKPGGMVITPKECVEGCLRDVRVNRSNSRELET